MISVQYKSKVSKCSHGQPEGSLFTSSFIEMQGRELFFSHLPYNAEFYARRHQVSFFESLVWLNLGLYIGLPAIAKHSTHQTNGPVQYKSV